MVQSTSSVCGAGTSWPTRLGARRAASSMRRPSAAFMAIRASHRTCLPAARAAIGDLAVRVGPRADAHGIDVFGLHDLPPVAVDTGDAEFAGHALTGLFGAIGHRDELDAGLAP